MWTILMMSVLSLREHSFLSASLLSRLFPTFCCTVYKYQGADINEPYNIYDVNRMEKKQLYTALSRTTKFDYISISTLAHWTVFMKLESNQIWKS